MLTLETFIKNWEKKFPALSLKKSTFIVAISGGVDSMVLAYLMHNAGAKISMAHANFQLRGEESTRDEKFVKDFASKYSIPLALNKFETVAYAQTYKMGIQEAAREMRYAWFSNLLSENISVKKVLLTAHHADDQVETVFMQLARGTGLHGLTGIPERREDALSIARPLLAFSKEEILEFATLNNIGFVEDSSNSKDDYTRNLFRHKIVPIIQEVIPHMTQNVLDTIHRLKESESIVESTVTNFWEKGLRVQKGILTIQIKYWKKVNHNFTYTWGLIKNYGFKPQQISEVHKLLTAVNGAYIATASHRFIKFNDSIQIIDNNTDKEHIIIHVADGELQVNNGVLHFEMKEANSLGEIKKETKYAYLDADKLEWPLLYRTWQATDYFYPLGLRKKKKLNHFLGGLKLSPAAKQQTAVLTMGDKLLWVVGQRIDDRYKITDQTKNVLVITSIDKH
ncbi:MAG: tRNA lysidine(34) synthetase TilS [Chitinophagia bacterium]|nr:tRNA lysidine(34) synthetase TilS [Chitinophagia bacterium]NDD16473.1 tRNA lysidine(34) synthetase TilS [Chitinophagia bacterium]